MNTKTPQATRRDLLRELGAMAATMLAAPAIEARASAAERIVLPFQNGERDLVAFPQKRPLIVLTSRPPQLETPFSVFN